MAKGGRIDYTVGFKADLSGLNSVKKSFKDIQNLTAQEYMIKFSTSNNLKQASAELEKIKTQAAAVELAFNKSFDAKLGTVNIKQFNNELLKTKINANDLFNSFARVGQEDVFAKLMRGAITANVQIKQTSKFLDDIGHTLTSTVRWGIASRLMNDMVGSIKGSFDYIKDLDTSLNDIRIVTGKSADEMERFARESNRAASKLGQTTKTYTDASLIYYQQGLSDKEVQARSETTLKAANVTGQTGEEVSEQLTAVWNGYKVSAEEAELYVDKLAAVAATTASDLEELSTGMSKVASAASVMGVPIDQLNAMLATTISVTRQAPESIGTAYKTIFARIGDIEAGDGEVTLGQYTTKMKELGFNVLDANQKLRDQGDVINEIGNNWKNLSREQQVALAQTMAGARQYNNLLALFDNWDMYTDALKTSADAAGTLNKQNETYLQSTEAHLNKLTAAQERFQSTILDSDSINTFADALTDLTDLASSFIEAIGGGSGVLLNFGSILTRVFSKQIAREALPAVRGIIAPFQNKKQIDNTLNILQNLKEVKDFGSEKAVAELRAKVEKDAKLFKFMTTEQQKQYYENLANYSDQRVKAEASDKRTAEARTKMSKYANYLSGKGKLAIDTEQYQEILSSDSVNFRDTDSRRILEARKATTEDLKGQTKILDDAWKALKAMKDPGDAQAQIETIITEAKKLSGIVEDAEQLDIITDTSKEKQLQNINEILQAVQNLKDQLNSVPRYEDESQGQINERKKLEGQKSEHKQIKTGLQEDLNNINEQIKYLETENKKFSDKKDGQGKSNFDRTVEQRTAELIQKEKEKLPEGSKLSTQKKQELRTQAITSARKEQEATEKMLIEYKQKQSELNQKIIQEDKEIKEINDKIEETKKGIVRNQEEVNQELNETLQKEQKNLNNASLFYNVGEAGEAIGNTASSNTGIVNQGDENVRSQNSRGDDDSNDLLTTQARAEAAATAVVNLSSQIMEMGSIINNIQALPNIWQNNEIDTGEKVGQTISNLAMTILPSAVNAFYSLATAATAAQTAMGIIGVITMAIGAVVGVISAVVQAQENERKARIEANKAIIEENNARLQEIDTNTKLYNSYSEMEKKYKHGNISKQELLNSTDELIDAYDIENGKLLQLTGNYQLLAKAIREGRIESEKENIRLAEENKQKSVENLQASFNKDPLYSQYYSEYIKQAKIDDNGFLQYGTFNKDKEFTVGKILDLADTESLKTFVKENKADSTQSFLVGILEKILESEDYATYISSIEQIRQSKFNEEILNKQVDQATTYEQFKESIAKMDEAIQSDKDFLNRIRDLNTEFSSRYYAEQTLLTNFKESIQDKLILPELQEKAISKLEKFLSTLSSEDLGILMEIGISPQDSAETLQIQINAAKKLINPDDLTVMLDVRADIGTDKIEDSAKEQLSEYNDLFQNFAEQSVFRQTETLEKIGQYRLEDSQHFLDMIFDPELVEEQKAEYEKELNRLNSSETKGLSDSYNKWNNDYKNKEIKKSDVENYTGKISANKEEIYKKFFDEAGALKEQYTSEDLTTALFGGEKGIQEIETFTNKVSNLESAVDKLKEGYSALEVDNIVSDQLKETTNQILQHFKNIQDIGSMLGDGFVVAADKVEEFASKFPELLKDYEVLSDGSIKLSQEQLQATIGTIHGEQKARAEAQIDNLKQQKEIAEMRIKYLEKQREATLAFLRGESTAQEYEDTLKKNGSELETNLSNWATKNNLTNIKDGLEAQGDAAKKIIGNINTVGEAYSELGSFAQAALSGKDPGEWSNELTDTIVAKSDVITDDFLASIGVYETAEEYLNNEDGLADKKQQAFNYLITVNTEIDNLKNNIEEWDKEIVVLESGINSSLDSVNDNLVDQLDLLDDVVDRYHDINVILGQIERLTNKIVKEQDKLVGPEYLGALEAENQAMDVTNLGLQKKREIAVGKQQKLQAQMADYGFTFNEDGTIGNYGGVMQGYINGIREAQSKGDKETAEDLQKRYDKVKELASNYDTLVNETIPDIDEEIEGNLDRKIENNIKKFNYAIKLQLDMSDAEKQWRDFRKKLLEKDDFKGQIEIDVGYLFNPQSLKNIENLIGHVNSIADEVQKMQNGETSSIYGNDLAQGEEDLEQAVNDMISAVEDWQSTYEAVSENLLNEMNKLSDTFNKLTGNYGTINEWLNNWKDVTSLTQGEESYAEFDNIYRLQHQANLEKLQADRESADTWKDIMDRTKEGSDEWNEAVDNWTSASSQLFTDFQDAIKNAADAFSNKIKLNFQNFRAGISNGGQIGDFEREKYNWEAAVKRDEEYLDTVTKSYEIDKLRSKINTEINKTSSSSSRQKLIDFQKKELKLLEEKDKLSQYDIDRSNKKYEILQKTIALEEAQNNKSQMRLRRDSQGNYRYQYIADTSAIAEAEQELKDLYQALYQLDEDKIRENTQKYYDLVIEMENKVQTAVSTLKGEALEKELNRIKNEFLPQFTELGVEQEQVYKNIQESASASYLASQSTAKDSFVAISGYVIGLDPSFEHLKNKLIGSEGSIKAAFDTLGTNAEGVLPDHVNKGITAMSELMFGDGKTSGFKGKLDTLFDQCIADSATFNENLKKIQGWSGIDITKTNADLATAADRTGTLNEKFKGLNTTLSTSISRLTSVNRYLQGVIDKTSKDIDWTIKIKENLEKVKAKFDKLAAAAAKADARFVKIKTTDYNKTVNIGIKYPNKWQEDLENFQKKINGLKGKTITITTNHVTKYTDQGAPKKEETPSKRPSFQNTVQTKTYYSNKKGGINKNAPVGYQSGNLYLGEETKKDSGVYHMYDVYGKGQGYMKLAHRRAGPNLTAYDYDDPTGSKSKDVKIKEGTELLVNTEYSKKLHQVWYNDDGYFKLAYLPTGTAFKAFDTGGYTGTWNSKEGRIAMLHEKELVLNAKDTKNILAAVNSVRAMQSIITSLDLNALAAKKQMISNLTTPIVAKEGITDNSLNQNVQIEANFPNVRDARQIEEAFDNLVNMASQYANKQTR